MRTPPRRDLCAAAGARASKLSPEQAQIAWQHLSESLQNLGDRDIPKFKDLFQAIRQATIEGKNPICPELDIEPVIPNVPQCKCGAPCEYYGLTGGFSVQCEGCNAVSALKARVRRRALRQP